VLTMMSEKLDWTVKLGNAFLGQQKDVMDTVQKLRAKAKAAGNLDTTKEQKVTSETTDGKEVIVIESTSTEVVYVPTYNPTVVYGAWPYPAYPPYYYYPPGYAAATAALSFTAGVAVGAALWGNCNWGHGDVNVNVNNYNNFTRNVNNTNVANKRTEIQANRANGTWQHDPAHRQGVQYRDQATQQRFNKGGVPNAQSREAFRGRAQEGRQELSRGAADQFKGAQGARGSAGGELGASRERQAGGGQGLGQSRDVGGRQDFGEGRAQQGNAFQGAGQGAEARSQSARGQSSLGAAHTSGLEGGGGARTTSFQGGAGGAPSGGVQGTRGGGGGFHGGGGRRR